MILLLLAALSCPKTEFINKSNEPLNDIDYWNYSIASKKCAEKYPNSPCLGKFIKIDKQNYQAICTAKK